MVRLAFRGRFAEPSRADREWTNLNQSAKFWATAGELGV